MSLLFRLQSTRECSLQEGQNHVYNAAHEKIDEPLYMGLLHELVHVVHNAEGVNRHNEKFTDPEMQDLWNTPEEKEATEGNELSEDSARLNAGMEERYGHHGHDDRPEVQPEKKKE